MLDPDRCFSPEPRQRAEARALYDGVRDLPLVCPHGHVDVRLLADPEARFGSPAELLVIPDHYVLRLLYSQGVPLEDLGVPRLRGAGRQDDHRRVWRQFCAHFHLFRGTPSGLWLRDELESVFGLPDKPGAANADALYDALAEKLARPEFAPRALFRRFGVEVLCTTDAATDALNAHRALQAEGFDVRPTFRPDRLLDLASPAWRADIARLGELTGMCLEDYPGFVRALERRRADFRAAGATACDHAAQSAHTERLSPAQAHDLFARALRARATREDAARFCAHMLIEFARMSAEDGLVMQLHAGSWRNHNPALFARFGPDVGADIPVPTEWTRGLRALLGEFGNDARLRLIVFTLDESTLARELAPLAGHYPALLLGAPWWFFDSVKGMERYLDATVETAGLANLAGFNDDTRAFPSIPARHDLWRRVSSNWLANLRVRGLIDDEDARAMAFELACGRARAAYRLEDTHAAEHALVRAD